MLVSSLMNSSSHRQSSQCLWSSFVLWLCLSVTSGAQLANGLAPEITDLNAADASYQLEAKLPDLQQAFLNPAPEDRKDGIPVGTLESTDNIVAFAKEVEEGKHGDVDSLLIAKSGRPLFESYYRRGRTNYPHYQMSIMGDMLKAAPERIPPTFIH